MGNSNGILSTNWGIFGSSDFGTGASIFDDPGQWAADTLGQVKPQHGHALYNWGTLNTVLGTVSGLTLIGTGIMIVL